MDGLHLHKLTRVSYLLVTSLSVVSVVILST